MTTAQDFKGYQPTWCPGCGNHGILMSLQTALVKTGYSPSSVAIVFGIGCAGNMNDFINAYAIHSLHGRSIPNAIGIKLANHKMPVVVIAGDGDLYGEGGNHLLHACRGNHNITVIVHDNRLYGLTTGQTSPRTPKGFKSKSTPYGALEEPLNPLLLAISCGATFVAQVFAGDVNHMSDVIQKGIQHKGFSLINVLQPCVTFNKINTYQYYLPRIYKLANDYQADDYSKALLKTLEFTDEKYPLGVIYQVKKPTFTDQLLQLKDKTLLERARFIDFNSLLAEFI